MAGILFPHRTRDQIALDMLGRLVMNASGELAYDPAWQQRAIRTSFEIAERFEKERSARR